MLWHAQIALELYFKDLRYTDDLFALNIIITIIIVLYLTLVKIHVNDKTNCKS